MTRTEALVQITAAIVSGAASKRMNGERPWPGAEPIVNDAEKTLKEIERRGATFDPEPAASGVRIVVTNPRGLAAFNMEAGTAADMLEGSAGNFWELGDGYRLFVSRDGEQA